MEERELISPVSLLERTRQDFQVLFSDHLSSDDSTKSYKKRRKSRVIEETIEMEATIVVTQRSDSSKGIVNQALFWHEEEQNEAAITQIAEEKKEKSQTSRHSSSSSSSVITSSDKQEQANSQISHLTGTKKEKSISQVSIRSSSSSGADSSVNRGQPSTHSSKLGTKEDSCLHLLIHQTGHLVLEQSKSEMMVVVHPVNIETGLYIISPQFTTSWKASESNFSNIATWNQQLEFKFNVEKCLPVTLFLLEIIDKTFSHIAWAFLRPVSRLGVDHCGKKLKLQLHHIPAFHHLKKPSVTDLFQWYQSRQKIKYPCVLYVTLEPAGNSLTQNASISNFFKECRTDGHSFKIPNKLVKTVAAGDGALMSCFSNDGAYLAVALTNGVIHVYEIAGSKVFSRLKGHRGNVYDLQWTGMLKNP